MARIAWVIISWACADKHWTKRKNPEENTKGLKLEPTTIIAAVSGLIKLGNALMKKFPDYKDRVGEDFNKAVLEFERYKKLPREKRVSSYMINLKHEIENHLIKASEFVK